MYWPAPFHPSVSRTTSFAIHGVCGHSILQDCYTWEANVMAKQHRSPAVGEDGGARLDARRSTRGRPWLAPRALVLVVFGLQAACG